MSWSPQLVHADGTSHTMTIDLPAELETPSTNYVITQQGWQDLYHIIATAVAKNTSESILLFWFSIGLLIFMAFLLLFRLIRGFTTRLTVLLVVLCVCIVMGVSHTVLRRYRVQQAVRKCVTECFYDEDYDPTTTISNTNTNAVVVPNNDVVVGGTTIQEEEEGGGGDVEQQQQQQHEVIVVGDNNIKNELIISDLDGLQGLEDDIFVPNTVGEEKKNKNDTMGFGRIIAAPLRQGFNSQSSSRSIHSGTSTTSSTPVGTTTTTGIGNRQRLPTDSSTTTKESTMIFEDGGGTRNRNHAMSRDGMYCVDWKWEYFGMDAVVKISWE